MGEPFDALNAGISAARGDWTGASLSAASMIPICGDAVGKGGKFALYGVKYSDDPAAARYADDAAEAAGRTLDDILANEELFRRWLKRSHPVGNPLSTEQAEKVWKKAVELGFRPRLDPGHPGKTWNVPHINIGGRHIPVAPGFKPPGS